MTKELSDKVNEEKVLIADFDSRNNKLYEALIGGVNRQTGHNYVPIIVNTIDDAKKTFDETPDIERAVISMYFSKEVEPGQSHYKPTGMEIVDHIRANEFMINSTKHEEEPLVSIPIIATAAANANIYKEIAEEHGCDRFLEIPFVATKFIEAMNHLKLPAVDGKYKK